MDASRNRIRTFELTGPSTAVAVRHHAEQEVATPGQLFAAYYYDQGATIPGDAITLAETSAQANHLLYDVIGLSKWHYAFMRGTDGTVKFVDCTATPAYSLCRTAP